ncbi:hypothetical protein B0T25DRAFT_511525 [Lasiosphaeria hispida]|uniref:Nephrocystin 3-like N-terminal domain-containing protein n=1 Tax=Lasiosphaeria hispida TaxID=260671 RepID=A0AAJ0H7H4_9PEZI|nr:hypothetical protein B0T25DRAFT_511525 [Lasiosphaeria hispida]
MEHTNAALHQQAISPNGLTTIVAGPADAEIDVIFVHGFTGDPQRTWTLKNRHSLARGEDAGASEQRPKKVRRIMPFTDARRHSDGSTAVYWPRDLVPDVLPDARVMTYGYDTHIRHTTFGPALSKNQVYDIAWDFLQEITAQRQNCPTRPILFVAHSLGGIVVKEALRRSSGCYMGHSHLDNVFTATVGIIFFGTPHRGSEPRGLIKSIAESLAKILGYRANEQIIDTLLPTSERLRELRDEFGPLAHRRGWMIHSFQEQLGIAVLNGDKVVEDMSSSMDLPAIETTQHINRNHMEMCRFSGPDDIEFKKVASVLTRIAAGSRALDREIDEAGPGSLSKADRKILLKTLGFDRIDARRLAIKASHPKTCQWLLEQPEYLDWTNASKLTAHHGFLWIRGHAGTGKSMLMRFALDRERKKKDKIVISFFFNARGYELERSTLGMYRSLLLQILEKAPRLQKVFDVLALTVAPSDGHEWSIESLKTVLQQAVLELGGTALTQISDMLSFFEIMSREATVTHGINLRVCLSSRHFPAFDITTGLKFDLEGQQGHSQDIENYVDSELKLMGYDDAAQLRLDVKAKAKGVFMWAALVIDLLNKEYNRGRLSSLRDVLSRIPSGLHSLIHDIMTREDQENDNLLLCIQWLLFSRRPLRLEELYHVITACAAFKTDTENQPVGQGIALPTADIMRKLIVDSSKGLVEVAPSIPPTVQFIHESVRNYLLDEGGLTQLWPALQDGPGPEGQSHERLKISCLAILKAYKIDDSIRDALLLKTSSSEYHTRRDDILKSSPLLHYAVTSLLYHADKAQKCGTSQVVFLEMLGADLERFITVTDLFEHREVLDANSLDEDQRTPLWWAARAGHVSVVRLLHREAAAWLDAKDRQGWPPLAWAADLGHFDVVRYLVESGEVQVDRPDSEGWTPLMWSASKGRLEVVRYLVATGNVNVEAKEEDGMTPLHIAVRDNRLPTVRFLIDQVAADPGTTDLTGRNPLLHVTEITESASGIKPVALILLATGKCDPRAVDQKGDSAISVARRRRIEDPKKWTELLELYEEPRLT